MCFIEELIYFPLFQLWVKMGSRFAMIMVTSLNACPPTFVLIFDGMLLKWLQDFIP